MPRRVDIEGQRFGDLVALYPAGRDSWMCRCDCGIRKRFRSHDLRSGKYTRCGCQRAQPFRRVVAG